MSLATFLFEDLSDLGSSWGRCLAVHVPHGASAVSDTDPTWSPRAWFPSCGLGFLIRNMGGVGPSQCSFWSSHATILCQDTSIWKVEES